MMSFLPMGACAAAYRSSRAAKGRITVSVSASYGNYYATQRVCVEQLARTGQAESAWHSFCSLLTLGELPYVRSTINGCTSICNVSGSGDAEHHHWMCCAPSSCCNGSASRDAASRDVVSIGTLSSRSACNASPCRRPSSVYTSTLFNRQQAARHLPTLTIRAEDR